MAAASLDTLGLVLRSLGAAAFVVAAPPFGYVQMLASHDSMIPSIPTTLVLIVIGCMHVYLLYRAYYALKTVGILVLTVFYLLAAYYVAAMFSLEPSLEGARWAIVVYLSLLYTYGLCYNFVDSFVSGLLHTKNV